MKKINLSMAGQEQGFEFEDNNEVEGFSCFLLQSVRQQKLFSAKL
jgi:hypothetical protein